jgi:hypothetical protein
MYLTEGATSTAYGDDGTGYGRGLYCRGNIKHCYIGMASLPVGTIATSYNGEQYISCGNEGWQGMKIS